MNVVNEDGAQAGDSQVDHLGKERVLSLSEDVGLSYKDVGLVWQGLRNLLLYFRNLTVEGE